MLDVALLTRGSHEQLTGGHLYHRRLAAEAASRRARLRFLSVRGTHDPISRSRVHADVALVDSLVAAAVAPWAVAAGRRRLPLAAIVHQPPGGVGHGALRTAIQHHLDLVLYRQCDLLFAVSPALADELIAVGLPAGRICVATPGCDGPAAGRTPFDMRFGRRIAMVCVGNWFPNKGILELLDAVAALPEGDVTLHLVGRTDVDEQYGARVRDRAAQPDLAERVVVHGPVEPDQLTVLYAGADAFALASYSETYGTVYAEALRAGLPVVGWRAGNLPNLIVDGIEGSLVEPGDIRALTCAISRLATDGAWRTTLAAGASRRSERLPTWADSADIVFEGLSRLATTRG